MRDEPAVSERSDLLKACRGLRQLMSGLCNRDPRDMEPAEVRGLIRRLRHLREAVERLVRKGDDTMSRERKQKVQALLHHTRNACREASEEVGDSLQEMRSTLSRLSDELSRLRSYRCGTASRGAQPE